MGTVVIMSPVQLCGLSCQQGATRETV